LLNPATYITENTFGGPMPRRVTGWLALACLNIAHRLTALRIYETHQFKPSFINRTDDHYAGQLSDDEDGKRRK
jgi:hypothetical protein